METILTGLAGGAVLIGLVLWTIRSALGSMEPEEPDEHAARVVKELEKVAAEKKRRGKDDKSILKEIERWRNGK